ncbi:MAG TPA: hypothetical protein ENI97_05665 [Gammaproteobacteria bacterium]|nr:hypothetical protein [Gammaproteobacteria bacterium]
MKAKLQSGVLGVVVLMLLAACASAPKVAVDTTEVQQAFKGKSVEQALEETEAAMARAEKDELDFYSPGFFSVAKKALDEARFLKLAPKEQAAEGASAQTQIFSKLLLANKSLIRAEATRAEVQKRLADVLKVRDSLIAKGIDSSNADEYQDVLKTLQDLFRRIERGDMEGFERDKAISLRQFRRLESQSVKTAQLDKYIALLEQAEAEGAGGAAPKSLKKTRQALRNAEAVIERDPNDQAAIKSAVQRFAFEVGHLRHVTREVKELRALNDNAMENILLAAESRLLAIADALGLPDPRAHNLREQTEMIVDAADKQMARKNTTGIVRSRPVSKNELELAQLKIEQLGAQLRDARAKITALERSKKPLNKRIDALERVVIKLNNEKAVLEERLAEAMESKAPPKGGVEITPVSK